MDNAIEETVETHEISVAKEVGKEFLKSIAVSAGAWGGLLIVGYGFSKLADRNARRAKEMGVKE